jgi:hypothetical protein
LLKLEYVLSEYFCKEGVCSCLFSRSIRTIKNYVLLKDIRTEKSAVSASCARTSFIS